LPGSQEVDQLRKFIRNINQRGFGKQDPRSLWLGKLRARRHPNVAAVALANKNARIVWAMLSGDTAYEPAFSVKTA
jgi:transposase